MLLTTNPTNSLSLLILSDVAGDYEMQVRRPFIGDSGKVLDRILARKSLTRDQVKLSYSISRAVARREITQSMVNESIPVLSADLVALHPKVIMACGYLPLAMLLGLPTDKRPNMMNERGRVYVRQINGQTVYIVASLSLHSPLADWRSEAMLDADLYKCLNLLYNGFDEESPKYEFVTEIGRFRQLMQEISDPELPYVTFDTETSGLDMFRDWILCISFSYRNGHSAVVPLVGFMGRDIWKEHLEEVRASLKAWFEGPVRKAGHNIISFDHQMIRTSLQAEIQNVEADTMLLHGVLDENQLHNLGHVASLYTGGHRYKEDIKAMLPKGGSYAQLTEDILWERAAIDTDVNHRSAYFLIRQAKRDGTYGVYKRIVQPMAEIMRDAEVFGIPIDLPAIDRLQFECQRKLNGLLDQCYHYAGERFDLGSTQQRARILYQKLGLPCMKNTGTVNKKTGNYGQSTDDEALEMIQNMHPIVPLLREAGDVMHDMSNYLKGYGKKRGMLEHIGPDGRVHPQWNVIGAKCVVGNTEVLTEGGVARIDSLVTHRVVGFDLPPDVKVWDGCRYRRPVLSYYGGFVPTIILRTCDGGVLEGTPEHPVLTPAGWVCLGDLTVGVSLVRYLRDGSIDLPTVTSLTSGFSEVFDLTMEQSNVSNTVPFVRKRVEATGGSHYSNPQGEVVRFSTAVPERPVFFRRAESVERVSPEESSGDSGVSSEVNGGGGSSGFSADVRRGKGKKKSSFCSYEQDVLVKAGESEAEASSAINLDKEAGGAGPGLSPQGPSFTTSGVEPSQGVYNGNPLPKQGVLEDRGEPQAIIGTGLSIESQRGHGEGSEQTGEGGGRTPPRWVSLCGKREVVAETSGWPFDEPRLQADLQARCDRGVRGLLAQERGGSATYSGLEVIGFSLFGHLGNGVASEQGGRVGESSVVLPISHAFITNGFVSHNTGRMSAKQPAIHNIKKPEHDKETGEVVGFDFRRLFIAPPGWVWLSSDYCQFEVFVVAYVAPDPKLIAACSQKDIHRYVASIIYECTPEEVSKDQRSGTKTVVFGTNYGRTPYSIAAEHKRELAWAEDLQKKYFTMFPGVKEHFDRTVELVDRTGEIVTPFGRKRHMYCVFAVKQRRDQFQRGSDEWKTYNQMLEGMHRQAVNMTVQSPASDTLSLACIRIKERFAQRGMQARFVLSHHDAGNWIMPREEAEESTQIVCEEMCREIPEIPGLRPRVEWSLGHYWQDESLGTGKHGF